MTNNLGITQAALWDRLNPKETINIILMKLNAVLSILDCKLIIKDSTTGTIRNYRVKDCR